MSRTLATVQLCSITGSVRVIGLRGEEACGRESRSRKAELISLGRIITPKDPLERLTKQLAFGTSGP